MPALLTTASIRPKRREHVVAQPLRIALDVAVHHARALAEVAREHFRRYALRVVMDCNARACSVKAARDAGADAAAGTGDEHGAFAQIE